MEPTEIQEYKLIHAGSFRDIMKCYHSGWSLTFCVDLYKYLNICITCFAYGLNEFFAELIFNKNQKLNSYSPTENQIEYL